MRIREFAPGDEAALRPLHESQGFGYEFPDLRDHLFVTKLVLLDEGKGTEESITAAALLRLTAEAYLLLDPREGQGSGRHGAEESDGFRQHRPTATHGRAARIERAFRYGTLRCFPAPSESPPTS